MRAVIRRGLDFGPAAAPVLLPPPAISSVALYGNDHADLKPRLAVGQGDRIEPGQVLFSDRQETAICFVSPVKGRVREVREGPRRRLQALVLDIEGRNEPETDFCEPVGGFDGLAALPLDELRRRLLESGLWTAIRQRPGDCLAPAAGLADVVLITAVDSEPWAPPPIAVLDGQWETFWMGVAALSRFARHATWVCTGPGFPLMPHDLEAKAQEVIFEGPHPAGLPGTHINRLAPLGPARTAWHIGYQDVAAVGRLLLTGRLRFTRLIGLAGPGLAQSSLVPVPPGAQLAELASAAATHGAELVSGSLLAGRAGTPPFEFLGRFHRQVTVCMPGSPKLPGKARRLNWQRMRHWQARPLAGGMLPHDGLERTWALETPPAALLRALMTGDHEKAVALGCLDLAEEDLALASLACRGGHDYGAYLREMLEALHQENVA
jgi:Na+-transporting NADH:ubiquinone oxidoreductase subunit A